MIINKLKTKCSSQGCSWTGDLLDLVTVHEDECINKLIKCKRRKCGGIVSKKDLENHEEVCLYKSLQCFHCGMNLWRKNKDDHELLCSTEKIQCVYHKAGCNTLMYRKDIDKHEQDSQSMHLKLSFKRSEKSETKLSKANSFLVENVSILKESVKKANEEIDKLKQMNKDLEEEVEQVKETSKVEIIILKDESFKLIDQLKDTLTGELNLIKENGNVVGNENQDKDMKNYREMLRKAFSEILEIQDDNSLIMKKSIFETYIPPKTPYLLPQLSTYYNTINRKFMADNLQSQNKTVDRNLLSELLNSNKYYWYKKTRPCKSEKSFKLLFPIYGNKIEDFCVQYKSRCEVQCKNNEIEVIILDNFCNSTITINCGRKDIEVATNQTVNPFKEIPLSSLTYFGCGSVNIFYNTLSNSNKRRKYSLRVRDANNNYSVIDMNHCH